MADVRSTRLRYISARTAKEISEAVSSLPFKVEIKGGPSTKDGRWFLYFVIPDEVPDFNNVEL